MTHGAAFFSREVLPPFELAGFWYDAASVERHLGLGRDALTAHFGLDFTLPSGDSAALSRRLFIVRFPVTVAVRAASVLFVARSAGGPFPDPGPAGTASGSGMLACEDSDIIAEYLAGRVALTGPVVVTEVP